MILIYISLVVSDVKQVFTYLLAILHLFGKMLVKEYMCDKNGWAVGGRQLGKTVSMLL